MTKLFLLDAYALIYRAYYAFIRNPRINSKGFNTSAILGFVNTLEDVLKRENPTHIGIAFDPSGPTFRHELYKDYKAQREATPEDIKRSIPIIKDIIQAYHIPILEVLGYEADDVIGTLAIAASRKGHQVYMMTPDKDYGQLVTDHVYIYRPKTGDKGFDIMGVSEICNKFGIQAPSQIIDLLGLMGDVSDNIPGCPGVGEKTAQKLIQEFGSIDNLLNHTNQLKGALQKKIEENKEIIRFSRFLATIKIDVPIKLNMENLVREELDEKKLRSIFEELEFHTLANRIFNQNIVEKKQLLPIQGDLFAKFADEGAETSEFLNLKSFNPDIQDYQLIDNEYKIKDLISKISAHKKWCFDTETTGIDPISAQLVGMSFCFSPNQAFYVPVPSNKQKACSLLEDFRCLFENESSLKIGQNIKFDILVLQNYGMDVRGPLFDTMIAHYLLQPELRHGMDYLSEIYLNYKPIPIEDLIGLKGKGQLNMRDVDLQKIYIYAAEDADVTYKLGEILEKELKQNQLEKLFYNIEMPLVRVLASMERSGVRISAVTLQQSSSFLTNRMNQLENEIVTIAGIPFNIASPKQVGEVLFEKLHIIDKVKKTKTGQYSTSEDVLESIRGKHPIVDKILAYRGIKKLLTTYIDALPLLVHTQTSKIHTSFNQTVTATGRLSSSNPNLQNIPIRDEDGKEIRRAFIPDDGYLFFSADYSQIELRIMAHLSQDPSMVEAFKSGFDIHAATAAKIYKVPMEEVTKTMRSKAKTANFGIIYGISVFGLAERLGIERKEAKELIDNYFKTYPLVREYMDKSILIARKEGYVETILNRRRFLPDINSHNAIVRGYAERNAINAPIQGSAADIIKIAMVRIWKRFQIEHLQSQMILQVHDELNFNVIPSEKEVVEQIVIQEMENAYPLLVPLKADCGWGLNWLEAH